MPPRIIEGTLAEVPQKLSVMPLKPEARLYVVITEPELPVMHPTEPFRPTEFRNGVPLLSRRKTAEPVTLELVNRLLEAEDEEILRAYRTPRS